MRSRARRLLLGGFLLAAGVASGLRGASAGGSVGVLARNGDRLTCDLAAGDADAFALPVSEGGSIALSLRGTGGLLPAVRVFRPDGTEAPVAALLKGAGKSVVKMKALAAAPGETGTWKVVVSGTVGTAGTCLAQFTVKTPAAFRGKGTAVPAGGTGAVEFTGDDGATATVKVTEKSGSPLAGARLLDPSGAEVPGSAAAFARKGRKLSTKPFPLAEGFGRYRVELIGAADGPASADVTVTVKFAKVAKRRITLGPEVRIDGLAPAVVRQGASGVPLAVAGDHFPPDAGASVSGSGVTVTGFDAAGAAGTTLTLDVAEDAPYGPRDLTVCPPELTGEPVTLAAAFAVAAPVPTVATSSVAVLRQGESGVPVDVAGTGFREGGALSVAGTGLVVGPTTFVSPSLVRTTLSAAADAPVGPRDLTFTQPAEGGGASATRVSAFSVNHPDPTLTAASPGGVRQGDAGVTLTLTGTNFRSGASVTVPGGGITVSNPTRLSDTSFSVTLAVSSSAAFGARDVVYAQPAAGGGATATLVSALTVSAPDPTIASISPGIVRQGATDVTLTLAGTGFRSGGAITVAGGGLTLGGTNVVSDTQATVTVSAAAGALVGARDVTFTQPASGGGASVTSQGLLAVHDPVPLVTSASPSSVRQGETGVLLTLTGDHFRTGGSVTVSGTGLTLSDPTRVSDTTFEVTLDVEESATLGVRDVTYTQPASGGGASAALASALRVNAPDPVVTSVSPSVIEQGRTDVTLTVGGTNFRSGGAVAVSGNGLTVGATTFVSESQATVVVSVAADAAFGLRDVTWTQPAAGGGASVTMSGALSVHAPTPTVASVSPASLKQGQSDVTVTVDGTGFRSGGALTISGTGLSVGATTFVSGTRATVTVSADADAAFGARDVTWTHSLLAGGASATKSAALTVAAPTPTVTDVSPATFVQGASSATLTVDGTGFRDGGAITVSGTGLTLGATTFVSASRATVSVSADASATFGLRDVTWTQPAAGGGESATKTGAVAVLAPAPTVGSVSPATLRQGQTNATLTVNGTNFRSGGAVTVSGTGISLGATTFVSDTQVTVAVASVDDAATVGKRSVTFTQPAAGGGATGTGTDVLTVNHPDPTITAVGPSEVAQSSTGKFTVTGTGFRSGFSVSVSGSGVTLSNPTLVSATSVTVDYSASGGASLGLQSLTYTQPSGGGGASATRNSAFEVKPPAPTVTSISPTAWLPGSSNFTVKVAGTGFNSGTTVAASGSGVTITNLSSGSPSTAMTLRVSVASDASVGTRDLTITPGTGGGPATTFSASVTVVPADPFVTSFSHPVLAQGASSVSVTIDGQNFRSGDTVSASGSGVTFSSVTRVSSTRLTATAAISGSAATGKRTITVSHASSEGGRSGSLANATDVTAATPTVTAVRPGAVGLTSAGLLPAEVPVTITGTNFMSGASAAVSLSGGSGLSIASGSEVVVSATTMTARLRSTASVTTGNWNVVVTNPGSLGNSGTSGNGLLAVRASTVLTVNNVVADSGGTYGGERVTVYGAGFATGDVVDFGTARAVGTQVLDANTIVTTVPTPASASAAAPVAADVKVTNTSASSATLTGGYTFAADAARFVVRSTFPAQGATNVPTTLRRTAVLLSAPCDTTTAPHGTTSNSTHTYWSSGSLVSSARGFDASTRWLVVSRSTTSALTAASHTISVPAALKSMSGTALIPVRLSQFGGVDQYTFTVGSGVSDTTAPSLSSISPANSATGADPTTKVVLVFSEEIDPLSVTPTNISFQQGGQAVASRVELGADLKTVTVTPETELAANTTYTTTVSTSLADFSLNGFATQTTYSFTTSSSDATAPTVDRVIVERLRPDLDGSGTCVNSSGTGGNAFDAFLPRSGFLLDVRTSDAGGSGIDPSKFQATCSVAVGSSSSGTDLASNFSVTPTGATWRVPSSALVGAAEDVTFTFSIQDRAGNGGSATVTVDVADKDATATGNAATGHSGGDHDPFDSRVSVVLRADLDRYTVTYSGSGSTNGATTSVAADNASDFAQSLRYVGLGTGSMTSAAASTVNGPSVGTNDIVVRLVLERIRELLRARYGIAEDGTAGADSVDVEFLLPGEQGSLSSLPAYASSNSASSSDAWSEMSFGGTYGAESGATTTQAVLGTAWLDTRNLRQEANLNTGTAGQTTGVYLLGMFKNNLSAGTSTSWRTKVLDKFVGGFSGAVPVGEGSDDDDVLAGTFDRASSGETGKNARYDAIMDAIEVVALYASAVAAHEIGHSSGLVADGAPKTGLFGNAHYNNTFTEATSAVPNTSFHLNAIGNDLMSASTDVESTLFGGADFKRFSGMDIAYLLNRLLYDEGR